MVGRVEVALFGKDVRANCVKIVPLEIKKNHFPEHCAGVLWGAVPHIQIFVWGVCPTILFLWGAAPHKPCAPRPRNA